jgi:hypothetical protein
MLGMNFKFLLLLGICLFQFSQAYNPIDQQTEEQLFNRMVSVENQANSPEDLVEDSQSMELPLQRPKLDLCYMSEKVLFELALPEDVIVSKATLVLDNGNKYDFTNTLDSNKWIAAVNQNNVYKGLKGKVYYQKDDGSLAFLPIEY